ncbi:hypothetical protein VKS41_006786 [Umbelopsis sp. WA50703]
MAPDILVKWAKSSASSRWRQDRSRSPPRRTPGGNSRYRSRSRSPIKRSPSPRDRSPPPSERRSRYDSRSPSPSRDDPPRDPLSP